MKTPKRNEIMWMFDSILQSPVRAKLLQINPDGWYNVQFIDEHTSSSDVVADTPHKFFSTKNECLIDSIKRLVTQLD